MRHYGPFDHQRWIQTSLTFRDGVIITRRAILCPTCGILWLVCSMKENSHAFSATLCKMCHFVSFVKLCDVRSMNEYSYSHTFWAILLQYVGLCVVLCNSGVVVWTINRTRFGPLRARCTILCKNLCPDFFLFVPSKSSSDWFSCRIDMLQGATVSVFAFAYPPSRGKNNFKKGWKPLQNTENAHPLPRKSAVWKRGSFSHDTRWNWTEETVSRVGCTTKSNITANSSSSLCAQR